MITPYEPITKVTSFWFVPNSDEPVIFIDIEGTMIEVDGQKGMHLFYDEAYALYKALELRLAEWDTLYTEKPDTTTTIPL